MDRLEAVCLGGPFLVTASAIAAIALDRLRNPKAGSYALVGAALQLFVLWALSTNLRMLFPIGGAMALLGSVLVLVVAACMYIASGSGATGLWPATVLLAVLLGEFCWGLLAWRATESERAIGSQAPPASWNIASLRTSSGAEAGPVSGTPEHRSLSLNAVSRNGVSGQIAPSRRSVALTWNTVSAEWLSLSFGNFATRSPE